MRLVFTLGLLATLAPSALAQEDPAAEAPTPDPQSTFVVPALPGEAVRVTVYAERPTGPGRLAQRYRGLRVQRSAPLAASYAPAVVVEPITQTPRAAFVRRAGSYFQVLPGR